MLGWCQFHAAVAGRAAAAPQAPGLALAGLTGIFTCFGPDLFFPSEEVSAQHLLWSEERARQL